MAEHDGNREGLLWKTKYYENCPGCRIDTRKETDLGIPYKDLLFIWIVALTTFLPISSLFPYIYFLIRDFNIAKRQEDIGYYAGFVGRIIFNALFGLSTNFLMAVSMRFLLGCFSGIYGPVQVCSFCFLFLMAVSVVYSIYGPVQETLHKHIGIASCETGMNGRIQENKEIGLIDSKESLLTNWPLISSIVVLCVFSLQSMAYTEVIEPLADFHMLLLFKF
ncbi:hypothetical protein C5167_035022 [Papaver somniferum]|uniref:Uncharacterized protein n=1 Tax=Papaver somniferum TaxID=3469 RepID=A0A4Y7KHI0_PAPSO|nr:hypothetical protein C5167_035022 [Papaver somniferum]